jgi:hypothetical protein
MRSRMKILITVKTYPSPSQRHEEIVCTAGVLENGNFIRLYPIDYRSRPYWQWYSKYQWVEVDVEKHDKDPRPESYRPIGEIKPIGKPISPSNNWALRKDIVLKRDIPTMCYLKGRPQTEVSLGIIKPRIVEDFFAEQVEREWKDKITERMQQLKLFGRDKAPLEKLPYRFSYGFTCEEPSCKGHNMMIEDWEIGELYRKMRDKHGEKLACDKVRERFLDTLCAENIDTYFYVGTVLKFGTWIILGVFWPKKQ